MNEQLYQILLKLPKKNLINLMWGALDEMQAYNGRSRTYCIMETLGAECIDQDNHARWKLNSLDDMKRNTETMGF